MEKKYYLGLDIGTNSCGYAVTDVKYNLLKYHGQKMWGVNLFDEANVASDRRIKRANRRRLDRRKLRLEWLREIFRPEIEKIDKNMLDRMKYSNLWFDDKEKENPNLIGKGSIFSEDEEFNDKKYFKNYKTIFHLREKLLHEPAEDIRLLYLALHNIIKRRGHFLNENDFNNNGEVILKDEINNFFKLLKETDVSNFVLGEDCMFDCLTEIDNTLENNMIETLKQKLTITDTKIAFEKILFKNKPSKVVKCLIEAFTTGKINVKMVFDKDKDKKLDFTSDNFDADILEVSLNEEQENIVLKLKAIYSEIELKRILGDKQYICEAMVDIFDEHKKQLKMFKDFIKAYYPSKKSEIFRLEIVPSKNAKNDKNAKTSNIINYSLYAGGTIYNNEKRIISRCADRKAEFYKYIKSILNSSPENRIENDDNFEKGKADILNKIENDDFLPLLRTKANGVYPNKLYAKEINQILETNKSKFNFLNKIDENGLTNAEKILKILSFKVPYFVGPISFKESKNKWAERLNNEPLKAWNLEKIVNFEKCEEDFITRMTNKCSYLFDQDVLPKHSLLYSKFRVLNELNKLKINGNPISVELKQRIYKELFKHSKKVTSNQLKKFLIDECKDFDIAQNTNEIEISGIDKEFTNNLASYNYLRTHFTPDFINQNEKAFEDIILWQTIINDKKRLINRIKRTYPTLFNEDDLQFLKSINFAGWGNLSRKFLQNFAFTIKDYEIGEVYKTNIIDLLYNTNQNLMEIVFNSNYSLNEDLLNYNNKNKDQITLEDVNNLYCSPSVKRGVWQTLKIIKEIEEIMGSKPSKIFVEVSRENDIYGENGRKNSRYNLLSKKYKNDEVFNFNGIDKDLLIAELEKQNNDSLRGERLYLYFTQLGKCMYSGKPIEITDLIEDNLYDIDHIIPQSLIKDDSIDNKVLVKKNLNADIKSDKFPLPIELQGEKQKALWKHLLKSKLISSAKYERLTRTTPLLENDLDDFINRQIVETNQSSKAVIDLLKSLNNDSENKTDIIYSKAKVVSDFRQLFGITKSRTINDFHHAKDAYLNIVVGNIINERFGYIRGYYKKENNKNRRLTRNLIKLFRDEIKDHNSNVIWELNKLLPKVEKICAENSPVVSKKSYYMTNGEFYDETIYKSLANKDKSEAKIALKGTGTLSNIERYGGFNKASVGYYMLIESDDKKNTRKRTIESVPVYLYQKLARSKDLLNKTEQEKDKIINERIFKEVCDAENLQNPRLVLDRINIQSTLKIGEGEYWLGGKTGDNLICHNANQWFVDNDIENNRTFCTYKTLVGEEDENRKEINKLDLPTTNYVKILEKFEAYLKAQRAKNQNTEFTNNEENPDEVTISKAFTKKGKSIKLTRKENEIMYDEIIKQYSKPIYKELNIGSISQTLVNKKEYFRSLLVTTQATILLNAIKRLSTGATLADLSKLKEGSNLGSCRINKNITKKKIKLIIRSVTGLKQKEINLNVI